MILEPFLIRKQHRVIKFQLFLFYDPAHCHSEPLVIRLKIWICMAADQSHKEKETDFLHLTLPLDIDGSISNENSSTKIFINMQNSKIEKQTFEQY